MFSKQKARFNWLATESAPKNFPMRIIEGVFYYRDEDDGLYIPTAASIGHSWGAGESTHVVGEEFKPLPDRVDIRFYSFLEDKLYQGSFQLPYDTMLALFKEGLERGKERPIFNRIMVGVAPGGAVSVWVSGSETREVFFGQEEPYESEIRTPLGSLIKDRQAYSRSYLERLPADAQEAIKKNGIPFGVWSTYRTTYKWMPVFSGDKKIGTMNFGFYNGESYPMNAVKERGESDLHPLPLVVGFTTWFPGDKTDYVYSIRFNEQEIYEAFAKLGVNNQAVRMEFDPRVPKADTRVMLDNGKETIALKHLTIRQ